MGLFDKTEDEKKSELERKVLTKLQNAIMHSNLYDGDKQVLINYVSAVKNKARNNDFYELDFLTRVILELIEEKEESFSDENYINNHLDKIIEVVRTILPAGTKTLNYDFLKEMIINNFVSSNGYIYRNIFDMDFYALFDDKSIYLDIMNIILSNKILTDSIKIIYDYAIRVNRYCTSREVFYRDMFSFLSGMKNVVDGDYHTYIEKCLDDARKRIGVYSIDEERIALCNSNVERIETYLDQMRVYETELDREKKYIQGIIATGKKDLKELSKTSIEKYKKAIEEEKTVLLGKLDAYLLELETSLRDKSDDVFKSILSTYQEQIREFRSLLQGYSRTASSELIRIQEATQESVDKLRQYVEDDEQLQKLLSSASASKQVRNRIIELVERGEEVQGITNSSEQETHPRVIIPGYDKPIVPAGPEIIIPEKIISRTLIPAFDDSIPFSYRIETILKKKEEEENKGAIYHSRTEQIIRDVIEGDWPYLWGPSGCGKSYLMKQVAHLLGLELVKNGKITEPYTIMGYNDPQGRFRATQTFIALLYGKLLAFDEFDNGNPDTQVLLNEIYSGLLDTMGNPDEKHFITFAEDVPAEINPNFRMISAGNTSGEGENTVFSSRGKIDESVQERMTPIFINYDNRVEERIFGDYKEWYKFFVSFRRACDDYAKKNGLEVAPGISTTRDAASIAKYVKHNSKSVEQILEEKFIQIKDFEYRECLARFIANEYGIDYNKIVATPTEVIELDKVDAKMLAKILVHKCKRGHE